MTIRCELTGTQTARAEVAGTTITATGTVPIYELCRRLLAAGVDPGTQLECYRDGKLCLQVRAIGAGGKLSVTEVDHGPRLRRWWLSDKPEVVTP
jgi:hypothetical protein